MLISITAANKDNTNLATREYTVSAAINLARAAMLKLQPMEESSADLMALKFMQEVVNGTNKTIENTANGHTLSFRRI